MAKKFKYQKKNDDYLRLWETEVEKIIDVTQYPNGKIRTTFEVKTKSNPKTCVYWGTLFAKENDKVRMKGFFNQKGYFIVESLFVIPPLNKEQVTG